MAETPRHEHSDIHVRRVTGVIAAIATTVVASAIVAWLMLRTYGVHDLGGSIAAPTTRARFLTATPRAPLRAFTAAKHAELERYGWVDAERRFARVPVEVAMRALASAPDVALPAAPAAAAAGTPALALAVGWHPHTGAALPLELVFRDESGHRVTLADYFGAAPVVLVFGYFRCRGLCPEVYRGASEALAPLVAARSAFTLVAVSIDPRDTPEDARERSRLLDPALERRAHFLTATDDSAAVLARAAGFGYRFDAKLDQFAHPAGLVIADAHGVIDAYLPGVRFEAARLRASLDGRAPRVSTAASLSPVLLLCFHYDPTTGRYSLAIARLLAAACLATVGALLFWFWRERRRVRA